MTSYYIKTSIDPGRGEYPFVETAGNNAGVPRDNSTLDIYSTLLPAGQAAFFGDPKEEHGYNWMYNYLRLTSQRVDNTNRVITGDPVVKLAKQAIIDYFAERKIDITTEFLYKSVGGAIFSLATKEGLEVDLTESRDGGILNSSLDTSWDWKWFCIGFDLPHLEQSSTTGATSDEGLLCEVEVILSRMSFCICIPLPMGKIRPLVLRSIENVPPKPGLIGGLVQGVGAALSTRVVKYSSDVALLNKIFDKFPDFWKDELGKIYNRSVDTGLGPLQHGPCGSVHPECPEWLPKQYTPDIEAYKPKVGASGKDRCDVPCEKTGKKECSSEPVKSLSIKRIFWIPCGKVSMDIPHIAGD